MFLRRAAARLIPLLMCGALAVFGTGFVEASPRFPHAATSLDWPQFHFTPDHRGFNPNETVLGTSTVGGLVEHWSLHPVSFANLQDPVLVDGVLYFGARFASPSSGNSVFAVDAASGQVLWQSEATQEGFTGAPAVADGLVFAVSSYPGTLYALDQATGRTVWTVFLSNNDAFGSQPTVSDGVVFVNSTEIPGKLFALDEVSGSILWSVATSNALIGSPAVAGDSVYVGGHAGTVYAFWAATGAPKWKSPAARLGFTGIAAAITAGVETVFAGNQDGKVYSFDANTGAVLWTFDANSEIYSSPAFAYGSVFIGTQGQWFYALKASTGRLLWRHDSGQAYRYFPGSPAVANEVVYEGEFASALLALDARTGVVLWSSPLIAQDVNTSPVVADGVVYATTYDGYVVAFGL